MNSLKVFYLETHLNALKKSALLNGKVTIFFIWSLTQIARRSCPELPNILTSNFNFVFLSKEQNSSCEGTVKEEIKIPREPRTDRAIFQFLWLFVSSKEQASTVLPAKEWDAKKWEKKQNKYPGIFFFQHALPPASMHYAIIILSHFGGQFHGERGKGSAQHIYIFI